MTTLRTIAAYGALLTGCGATPATYKEPDRSEKPPAVAPPLTVQGFVRARFAGSDATLCVTQAGTVATGGPFSMHSFGTSCVPGRKDPECDVVVDGETIQGKEVAMAFCRGLISSSTNCKPNGTMANDLRAAGFESPELVKWMAGVLCDPDN